MTNFFRELFSDDSGIIGLCAFETKHERRQKRINKRQRAEIKINTDYSSIIFKRSINKFIGQIPCRV
ncbi:hypothetical protein IKQ26_09505 [bacterium]|nr:hypothetical protein [bacterium]